LKRFAAAAALLLAACGPAKDVTVSTKVAVTITPTPDRLPFDPRAARISTAQTELARIVGHDIVLDVDAAIVPEFRSSFEDALGHAFENLAKDMRELKERSPDVFAFGASRIDRVSLRYDATLVRDEPSFDPAGKTLTLRGPARHDALVRRGTLQQALEKAYRDFAKNRYDTVAPEAVPAQERRAYFEWLTRGSGDDRPKTSAELAETPHVHRIAKVLRFAADPSLAKDAHTWLSQQASWFVGRYVHEPDLVRGVPAASTFKKTEAAYAEWMKSAFAHGSDEERVAITQAVFVRSFQHQRAEQGGKSYPPHAWPTLDKIAFGLEVIDAWRRDGHPTPLTQPRMPPWQELVVCPSVRTKEGASYAARCEHDFYRYAIESEQGKKRLAQALLERHDEAFAQAAFANVRRASEKPLEASLGLLRAVESDPVVWTAGLRVIAEEADNVNDIVLLEEAQRLWLERPAYRGPVLFLLARIDRYGHDSVDWAHFDQAFQTRVDSSVLKAYLDEGPLAFALLPNLWPALGKGYSRTGVILPKADAFLAQKMSPSVSESPYTTMQRILSLLCEEKNVADLEAVKSYILARVASHPGEPYAALADDASGARCKPAPPRPPAKATKLVDPKKRPPPQRKDWDW
jgi:hypothetical protein